MTSAVKTVTTATGSGVLFDATPMTKPSSEMARQASAGTLLKPSAVKACAAPSPMAAIAKIHAVAERTLRATLSRILHVVTA
jgi:uncharacterized ferritin-like protein (DUF455 family)